MAGGARAKGRCPYCAVAVKEENLPRHIRTVHPGNADALKYAREVEVEARRSAERRPRPRYGGPSLSRRTLTLIMALVVAAAAIGALYLYGQQPNPNLNRDVLEICYEGERFAMHRHADINILVNGLSKPVQAGLGIPTPEGRAPGGCWRPLHVHDDSGKIHIEADVLRDWTLGDFFKVWAADYPLGQASISSSHLRVPGEDKTIPGPIGNATLDIFVDDRKVPQYDGLVMAPISEGSTESAPEHRIRIEYRGP